MKKIGFTAALILAAVLGNIATSYFSAVLKLPAFFDTIFTTAITFYAGLVPGIIVAALTNPLITVLRCAFYGTEIFYFDFLYSVCGIFIVLTTWAISRNKKEFFFKNASGTRGEIHFGMSGMEMRSKLLGAKLNIKSDKETGTEIRLEIPG